MQTEEYQIRQTRFETEEEFEQLVELQNEVYKERGLKFSTERFKQWYYNNPAGRVLSFNAFYDEKMVAHYACIPCKMVVDGNTILGIKSMATVTHPDWRGKGLFKKLAGLTYEYAKQQGYKFVIGVANANSFPGFMKYFPFTFVSQLEVKIVLGVNIKPKDSNVFLSYWDSELLDWRSKCTKHEYNRLKHSVTGNYNKFVNSYMGTFDKEVLNKSNIPKKKFNFLPLLYIGIGAEIKSLHFTVPKFIKHSPFNLIFMDLTDGQLPQITKDNIFFQLYDFDVN